MLNSKFAKITFLGIDICAGAITLTALLVFGVFVTKPSIIEDLDHYLLERHKSHYENMYYAAQSALNQNTEKGLALFLKLDKEFESVKKSDLLDAMKRLVFAHLSNIYINKKDYDSALHLINKWIIFDEKDFNAKLRMVDLLLSMPGKHKEGIDYLDKLYERHPDVNTIKQKHDMVVRF